MPFDLDRFKQAQDSPHAGIAVALRELRAGRKTSHWIWYVFPQLVGLGRSSTAVRYGLAGLEEAAAYLRDPGLCERLAAVTAAARAHLAPGGGRAARIEELMGSRTDAAKLVSCMTLFRHVAGALRAEQAEHAEASRPELAALADDAAAILAAAAVQGYPPCAYTEQQLGGN